MKALSRFWIIPFAGVIAMTMATGCTPEGSQLKQRDYRNVRADDRKDALDYDEESHDFGDSRDRSAAVRSGNRADDADRDGGDSSYKKERFYQTGAASWYGREFHGKKTASGERFDMNEMTAAHKVLPFGTLVQVKNFENGKSVTVRINDRGPYRGKRIIDLSHAAARELGMLKAGEAQVGIRISGEKGEVDEYADENARGKNRGFEAVSDDFENDRNGDGGAYAIQAGAFYSQRNADNLKMRLEVMTNNSVRIVRDGDMYKVRIEGILSKSDVTRLKRTLADEDIPSFVIQRNE
ncbi:MAG: septal ring lytic transglycosylase RlpA family protein [Chrysiogenales bacterium]|nr:MAG: septal ring lytic transglycosylase RlpA family protein [Chrysiogenales bacterium]